ncbi:MAG: TolC family protein [Myxococcales bacterium]|nr:TolC family protein [Myxococcales bacterium]
MRAASPSRDHRAHAGLLVLALVSVAAHARADAPTADPVLAQLIADSLAARPELAARAATVRAQRARVPQAGALPDPMLQVGIQNDGFTGIEIGTMPTSFVSIMIGQTFPWPGKRDLRTQLASLDVDAASLDVDRLRRTTEADVRRAYLALVLARDRLALLDHLTALWGQSAEAARLTYEVGGGAQSDILRAQLEQRRLAQRRLALEAEAATLTQELNRLRGHDLDEPIAATPTLAELGAPAPIDEAAARADALAQSPELARARLAATAGARATALARKGSYPDLTVSAGIMVRGVDLPPMWQLSVGVPLPIYADRKQRRAVAERRAQTDAARLDVDAVAQVLTLRVHERATALAALAATIAIYRDSLLPLSKATAESTLAQYAVGKVSFAAVLDGNAGVLGDEDAYLRALAAAHRLVIALDELSLAPVAIDDGGAMTGATMPGVTATTAAAATTSAPAAAAAAAPAAAGGGMGGM